MTYEDEEFNRIEMESRIRKEAVLHALHNENERLGLYKDAYPEQEPVSWESLLGAVARGWCYEENANKTMDTELAVAIAKEVQALYATPPRFPWVGLSDRQKLFFVKHAPDLTVLNLIEQVEDELKRNNA